MSEPELCSRKGCYYRAPCPLHAAVDTAVKPTRPPPEPPARMSAAAENAEQIGDLQARVSQLEGQVTILTNARPELQGITIRMLDREMKRLQDRIGAPASDKTSTVRPHVDSGLRCLAAEHDGQGKLLPPCIQCQGCGEFIRPESMGRECPGKPPACDHSECWTGGKVPAAGETVIVDTNNAADPS